MSGEIRVREVASPKELKAFLAFTEKLYADDPAWIQPLYLERLETLDPRKNPYFRHAEAKFWLAEVDGRPVGRISAQIDRLALETIGPGLGHFGFYEAEDDPAVAHALVSTAETWLKTKGMTRVTGPFHLSVNDETGLLVDGFEHPPRLKMPHGRPYYDRQLTQLGYRKARDLWVYNLDLAPGFPPKIHRIVNAAKANPRITYRQLDLKRLDEEIRTVFSIFNDAWSDNWGFVPMTEAELAHAAKALKPLLRPPLNQIAYYDGEPAAFMLTLPDINHLVRDLNGRLLPFGWAKLLYRLKLSYPKQVRVPLMGVLKSHQRTRAGISMAMLLINEIRDSHYKRGNDDSRGELGWILEDNQSMNSILEAIGSDHYKTYRVYEKALAD